MPCSREGQKLVNGLSNSNPVPVRNDSLMGWVGQGDTRNQVKMRFPSKDLAIAFCEKKGLDYEVSEPKSRTTKLKSYSDNFSHDRDKNWTH